MPESPAPESTPTLTPIPKAERAPSWFTTIIVFCAIVCTNVGYIVTLDYYCGLTWRFPVTAGSILGLFLIDVIVLLVWATTLNGRVLKTLVLLPSVILSFCLIIYVEREYRPFARGLTEALHRTDLEPLRQWAVAHRPPKSEFPTHVSVEESSIPDEVWRTIPYKDGKPYFAFYSSSEADDWILVIDHSLCGFMYHHGFVLTLGKDLDPTDHAPVIHPRRVDSHLWVFPG